jgi:hypothetical protein
MGIFQMRKGHWKVKRPNPPYEEGVLSPKNAHEAYTLYLNTIKQAMKKIEKLNPTVNQRVAGSSPAGGAAQDSNYFKKQDC